MVQVLRKYMFKALKLIVLGSSNAVTLDVTFKRINRGKHTTSFPRLTRLQIFSIHPIRVIDKTSLELNSYLIHSSHLFVIQHKKWTRQI
jgi:hypothetical protein